MKEENTNVINIYPVNPDDRLTIITAAKKDNRSISNFCYCASLDRAKRINSNMHKKTEQLLFNIAERLSIDGNNKISKEKIARAISSATTELLNNDIKPEPPNDTKFSDKLGRMQK